MRNVVIGILGTKLDAKFSAWKPTLSLIKHKDLPIHELALLYHTKQHDDFEAIKSDINKISPNIIVTAHQLNYLNPWDFVSMYTQLYNFSKEYSFDLERNEYLIHISTGTHIMQICLFLLNVSKFIPGKLIQAFRKFPDNSDAYDTIDLELARYNEITSRLKQDFDSVVNFLKDGIETRDKSYNVLIDRINTVSVKSDAPILLTGPTGAGKSQLAKRIYEIKKDRFKLTGKLITVNCATLRGDNAMSTLFGHAKGAFTGALNNRIGLLKEADKGVLFLDEIGELGLEEQAMLLRAIEDKLFMPMGKNIEDRSDFQLIAGTNRNLFNEVRLGKFREDLLARINLWTFQLPSLKQRIEDIEPNIELELNKIKSKLGYDVSFNKDAYHHYLEFAKSPDGLWLGNFRDLISSITRMATLANARITKDIVDEEISCLKTSWSGGDILEEEDLLTAILPEDKLKEIDLIDRIQLVEVVKICRTSRSIAEAGRKLFNVSRTQKSSTNDSNRLKRYLERYGLSFKDICYKY